jgi:manganese/iron transport system substrate-binding protein
MYRKIRRFWCLAALSLSVIALGCNPTSQVESQSEPDAIANSTTSNALKVVATSSLLCDLVKQIAVDTVALTCLLEPSVDPHAYNPTPSDRKSIEDADLVFYIGYEYEPDLIQMIAATNTPAPKVAVVEEAVPNPMMGEGHAHEDEENVHGHDETGEHTSETEEHSQQRASEGDEHTDGELVPDPHVWHHPQAGIPMVEVVSEQLAQLAPEHAALYAQNTETLTSQLTQLDAWMREQVATVPESARKLVTTHDSFHYFAAAYGFEVGGTISGLSTDERPSAARVAALVDIVKDAKVPAIFAEGTTNRQAIDAIARDANVTVADQVLFVEGPGGEETPAKNYQMMLVTNTCTIVNALNGQCDVTTAPTKAP